MEQQSETDMLRLLVEVLSQLVSLACIQFRDMLVWFVRPVSVSSTSQSLTMGRSMHKWRAQRPFDTYSIRRHYPAWARWPQSASNHTVRGISNHPANARDKMECSSPIGASLFPSFATLLRHHPSKQTLNLFCSVISSAAKERRTNTCPPYIDLTSRAAWQWCTNQLCSASCKSDWRELILMFGTHWQEALGSWRQERRHGILSMIPFALGKVGSRGKAHFPEGSLNPQRQEIWHWL